MKGTACALFGVATHHRLVTGVMVITGAITLVTWLVVLATYSYMRTNGSEAPKQDAVGVSSRQGGYDVRFVGVYFVVFPSRM